MTEVRTRFAPSPTGFQHIGGFRTAFFAWLLAKHFGGTFILRVEDTDQERSVPGAIKFIIEELAWFGISIDEGPSLEELAKVGEVWDGAPQLGGKYGPYVQSQRRDRYREVAEELISRGCAYRCDCTSEMLEKERAEQMARKEQPGYSGYCRTRNVPASTPHVVRLKLPARRSVTFVDAVRGRVTWDNMSLRDPVLLKSDGFPTYHLAVVVDDHDMKITHALRGEEWLSSTPIHLLLYEFLEWEPVTFAHLPVIKGPNGQKLSKRNGAPTSRDLRDEGYLPQAILNFATLIGWSPGEGSEQEIFSTEELIKLFTLEKITESSGVFDKHKLEWMNGVYIRSLSDAEFVSRSLPYLEKAGVNVPRASFEKLAVHVKERVKTLLEVAPMIDFLAEGEIVRDVSAMYQKGVDAAKATEILKASIEAIEEMPEFTVEAVDSRLRGVATQLGLKVGPTFVVLRIAVTGKTVTPPLFESFAVLGKDTVLSRLRETLALIR